MVDLVELSGKVYVDTHVVVYVLEVRLVGQERGHVLEDARAEVVYTDDFVALGHEPLAEVATDEASPPVTSALLVAGLAPVVATSEAPVQEPCFL